MDAHGEYGGDLYVAGGKCTARWSDRDLYVRGEREFGSCQFYGDVLWHARPGGQVHSSRFPGARPVADAPAGVILRLFRIQKDPEHRFCQLLPVRLILPPWLIRVSFGVLAASSGAH